MKICFPVSEDKGLSSRVYGHFGSAPLFVIVDTDVNTSTAVRNGDRNHAHGACNPVRAVGDSQVDAVVVGGIGGGALGKLSAMGIKVYQAVGETVEENVSAFISRGLPEFALGQCCGGHGHGGGCSH